MQYRSMQVYLRKQSQRNRHNADARYAAVFCRHRRSNHSDS